MTICGPNQQLTSADVAQYMRNAGFPESAIQTGLAVSYGESGWESGNCNLADANGGSYGLWQINGIHFLSGGVTKACAFDPQCATNYAYQLWKGQGWNPWGAYTDGRYLQFMNNPVPAGSAQPTTGTPLSTDPMSPGAIWNTLQGLFSGSSDFYQWLSNPVRIIKMIVGVGLVFISVAVLFLPQAESTVRKVANPIRRLTPKPKKPPKPVTPKKPVAPKKPAAAKKPSSQGKPKP